MYYKLQQGDNSTDQPCVDTSQNSIQAIGYYVIWYYVTVHKNLAVLFQETTE